MYKKGPETKQTRIRT